MIGDERGQVSLEYLLIFSISLIILVAFTLPLLEESMSDTFDVSDSIKAKSDLSNMAQAIREVYGQGQGSKKTVSLDIKKPVTINVTGHQVSSKIKLNNKQQKEIKINVKSKLESTSFKLSKGKKNFIIEWPVNNDNMLIYQK